MENIKIFLKDLNKSIYVEKGTNLYEIVQKFNIKSEFPIVLGKINDEIVELRYKVEKEGIFEVITTRDDIGKRTYERTLQFILVKAAYDILKNCEVNIEHSLSKGFFCEIYKNTPLTEEELKLIENKMREIIEEDILIEKVQVEKDEAIEIFRNYNMQDKVLFLQTLKLSKVSLYKLQDRYDYFYGTMAYSTGNLKVFELRKYNTGFIIRFPSLKEPNKLPEFIEYKKLAKIFYEAEEWQKILYVTTLGSLNKIVDNGDIKNLILVNEALHEKKVAYIADNISQKKKVKLVLIAGPSSSGKTTFTKRLSVQLAVNGLIPVQISMDDYFVDRELTPKDENGNYDFESLYALDIKLFNDNLTDLLQGKEVDIPSFNFLTGQREWKGNKLKLPENGVILIEGIHGLNEKLTQSISKEQKYKVYINCLTQLNIDNHNRIPTTDVRIIRRMVRDSLIRGYTGEDTLKMWPSVKRGEKNNIFVFQEEADVIFNSNLIYELCILKKYALKELNKVDKKSSVYYEALRLKSFLNFFREVDVNLVPSNSLLREFIGGSCFYNY